MGQTFTFFCIDVGCLGDVLMLEQLPHRQASSTGAARYARGEAVNFRLTRSSQT